jgi:hypothetical protein
MELPILVGHVSNAQQKDPQRMGTCCLSVREVPSESLWQTSAMLMLPPKTASECLQRCAPLHMLKLEFDARATCQ